MGLQARLILIALAVSVWPAGLAAQPIPQGDVPPELRRWVPWVLDEVANFGCAEVQGTAVCVWPGRLRLSLTGAGGGFEMAVSADRSADLRLPGDLQHWPQAVSVDGRPAPVVDRSGAPTLRLASGTHRVKGRFAWTRLPESLPVPPEVALLDLAIDGRRVAAPRRERGGMLWLRARAERSEDGESLRVQVFRRIRDGIPLFVETTLSLQVSGKAREARLDGVLLRGAAPVAVRGGLPARLDADRRLRVQVRGGRFEVTVVARVDGPVSELRAPRVEPAEDEAFAWPEREVWVFEANETLRQVELSGAPAIDPSRTELPDTWRTLPAFLLGPDAALQLREVRRGQPEPPPDRLQLAREIWLDLDGGGYTFRDNFSGALNRTWRLDLLPPGDLGRAVVSGQDQLITARPESGAAGVELRRSALSLSADSRAPRRARLAAVGWTADVEQLSARLHLPPGWSILTASGVDALPGTWASRWTLLGFFFVLLATFASHRLVGWRLALVTLAALVLSHREPGAPFVVWLSLLGAMALRRAAPVGRLGQLARIWWLVSAGVLLLSLVPFARDQVRAALFPQVAQPRHAFSAPGRFEMADALEPGVVGGIAAARDMPAEQALEEDAPTAAPARSPAQAAPKARAKKLELAPSFSYNVALEQEPHAVLQTGPAVLTWRWQTFALDWTGPVSRDHEVRLFLVSPALNAFLTALRLVLVGWLAAALLLWPRPLRVPRLPAKAAGLLIALLLTPASAGAQEIPNRELLEELKRRLTRDEPCAPACATTASVVMRADDVRLSFSIEVHAAARTNWKVPGPVASWVPDQIVLNGAAAAAVARLPDGFLHVRLDPGVHRFTIGGPIPPQDSFTLQFGDRPRRARAAAPGWEVVGFREDGPADASIRLTRRLRTGRTVAGAEGVYAPWLEVARTLSFGVSWQVVTEIRRLSPRGVPVAVRVPLLPGEALTDARYEVEQGEVVVGLGRDDVSARWTSTLERAAGLTLTAPEARPWSEVWRLQCSVVWECDASGLPPVRTQSAGVAEPEFRPWPGESIEVALRHPEGIEGQTLTLERVDIDITPGVRLERARLVLAVRSSRQESLSLGLPEGVDVQEVSVDGAARPSRPVDGRLRVTLPAGAHRLEVRWHQERGMGLLHAMPRVDLARPAANVHLSMNVAPDRWLLVTRGPAWGPSVLFWTYLVFALIVALLLGRVPGTPLSGRQWALLTLGLSQISAVGALLVAGFFLALAWRQRRPQNRALAFDALQLLLLLWAFLAMLLLYQAIETGLLFRPDMQVGGNGSSDSVLRWYADRVAGLTPSAGVLSLPLGVYRGVMLLWALWLASSLVRWAAWAWRAFNEGGAWRPVSLPRRKSRVSPDSSDGPDASGDESAAKG